MYTSAVPEGGGLHGAQSPQWQSLLVGWRLQPLYYWQWELHPLNASPQHLPEPTLCLQHGQLLEGGWQLFLVQNLQQHKENTLRHFNNKNVRLYKEFFESKSGNINFIKSSKYHFWLVVILVYDRFREATLFFSSIKVIQHRIVRCKKTHLDLP